MSERGSIESAAAPASLGLTFRGLQWCDGCGTELARGEQLAGLCPGRTALVRREIASVEAASED